MYRRALDLPLVPEESLFFGGPRQTGKSSLLKKLYPRALWIDLLKSDEFLRYSECPGLLRQELRTRPDGELVVIDEVQKVPMLLDEVHWCIENTGTIFVLCGSSARRVKRGHANLLGGRAVRYELFGLVSDELGDDFNLERIINHGYLPRHYMTASPTRRLQAYVNDYIKEEIAAEGFVRNLPVFFAFLRSAALSDGELVNFANIARDAGVSAPTVKEYFQILQDTLLGRFLPAYRKRLKRRVILSPKFFFFDVGVVNLLASRGRLEPGSDSFGKALENWVFHELSAHREYSGQFHDLNYWRLASGIEVDFIINDMEIAIEVKSSRRITGHHLKGLRELGREHPSVKKRYLVCLEGKSRQTDDGIQLLPAAAFARKLWANQLF